MSNSSSKSSDSSNNSIFFNNFIVFFTVMTRKDYLDRIMNDFLIETDEEAIYTSIGKPTSNNFKNATKLSLEKRCSTEDIRLLNMFLNNGRKGQPIYCKSKEDIQDAIDSRDYDPFNKVCVFIKKYNKGKKSNTEDVNMEFLAWLSNFEPRPFLNFLREGKPQIKQSSLQNDDFGKKQRKGKMGKKVVYKKLESSITSNWLLAILFFTLSMIFGFFYIQNKGDSFNTIIQMQKARLDLHPDYPIFNRDNTDKLVIDMPYGKIEKNIDDLGQSFPLDVPAKMNGKFVGIRLVSKYWETTVDSLLLDEGKIKVEIRPNRALAKIEGEVFHKIGGVPIIGVTVSFSKSTTITNKQGNFSFEVPITERKENYSLKFFKEGYEITTKLYYPGDRIKIAMIKSK